MTDLFSSGSFIANSGKTLDWKIECDALSDGSISHEVSIYLSG